MPRSVVQYMETAWRPAGMCSLCESNYYILVSLFNSILNFYINIPKVDEWSSLIICLNKSISLFYYGHHMKIQRQCIRKYAFGMRFVLVKMKERI